MTTRKEGPPAERVSETIVAEAVSEPVTDHERQVRVLDAVAAWHACDKGTWPLHAYLGWTWEEYKRHVEQPGYLPPKREGAV